jgi:hypothetical protein
LAKESVMKSVSLVYAIVAAGAACGLGACTTLPVTTDSNPNASVASCRTYTWAQEHVVNAGEPGAFGNPLNADRLRAAIEGNLSARGIRLAADGGSADCVVGYAIGSRVAADPYPGWGYGGYYGGWRHGYGYGFGFDYPYVHDEGRITVDLFDAHTRAAIWHASVSQNVVGLTGPNAELKINAAAAAIFTKFPVLAVPGAPGSGAAGRAST